MRTKSKYLTWICVAAAWAAVGTAAFGQGTVGPVTLCSGAARLDNGSVVCLGQPCVGVMSAADGSVTVNAGIVPAIAGTAPTPEPIRLTSFGLVGGVFSVSFQGVAGRNYVFQASTNLTQWESLRTNTAGVAPVLLEDSQAGQHPRRFYRVWQP